jgi:hypothetical protein
MEKIRFMSRLKERYTKIARPWARNTATSVMAIPKLEKIVINIGLGEAIQNSKLLDNAADELSQIAGQRRSSREPRSRLPLSSSERECRLAAPSRCAESGCLNFWIGW